MNDVWTTIFSGVIEGRNLTLSRYSSGDLKVTTTQKNTVTTTGSSDGTTHVFPMVISEGDTIEVDAESITELEAELQTIGFSVEAAKQISAHAA